jgi:hypothetical protein
MPDDEDTVATLDLLKEELVGDVQFTYDPDEGPMLVLVVPTKEGEEPLYLAVGAIIRGKFGGKRVRVTIEELKP